MWLCVKYEYLISYLYYTISSSTISHQRDRQQIFKARNQKPEHWKTNREM